MKSCKELFEDLGIGAIGYNTIAGSKDSVNFISNFHSYVGKDKSSRYDKDFPSHKSDGYLWRSLRTIFCKPEERTVF